MAWHRCKKTAPALPLNTRSAALFENSHGKSHEDGDEATSDCNNGKAWRCTEMACLADGADEGQRDGEQSTRNRLEAKEASQDENNQVTSKSSPFGDKNSPTWWPILALCFCTLTQAYLIVSISPYVAFMVIKLFEHVDGVTVDRNNAGRYAGWIGSSFHVGRILTSYGWGKLSDIYGRKPMLLFSLLLSGLSALAFGFSTHYSSAVLFRVLLGVCGGLLPIAKTCITESARGDKQRETRNSALFFGTFAYGSVVGAAAGGYLADPLEQYPQHFQRQRQHSSLPFRVLQRFPFLLPNLLGCLICLLTMTAVYFLFEETLPNDKRRDFGSHIFSDTRQAVAGLPKTIAQQCVRCFYAVSSCFGSQKWRACIGLKRRQTYKRVPVTDDEQENDSLAPTTTKMSTMTAQEEAPSSPCLVPHLRVEDDSTEGNVELVQRLDANKHVDENMGELGRSRATSHGSATLIPLRKRETCGAEPSAAPTAKALSVAKTASTRAATQQASKTAIFARPVTRQHLISYWLFSFVSICMDEALPLFAVSPAGGLGLGESSVGTILSFGGLVYGTCQYFVLTGLFDWLGLYPAMKIGTALGSLPVILIPLSLFWHRRHVSQDNPHDTVEDAATSPFNNKDELQWTTFVYLVLIVAFVNVFSNVLFGGMAVAVNRTVPGSLRGTTNGIAILGVSLARALGPPFAGYLVSWCFTSWSSDLGAFVVYGVIAAIALLVFAFISGLQAPSAAEEEREPSEEHHDGKRELERKETEENVIN